MTTITIQIENPSVLAGLKKIFSVMEGVSIVDLAQSSNSEKLNATTINAINEVKAGKTMKAASADDLIAQCLA